MNQYLMLLYPGRGGELEMSAEDMQRVIGEYMAWADRIRAAGALVDSQKLRDDGGRFLKADGDGGVQVLDGPFSETKELVGGFYLVKAESYEEVVALADDSPHLRMGGTIEVREIEPTG